MRNEGDVEIKEALNVQEERGPDLSRPQRSPEGRGRHFTGKQLPHRERSALTSLDPPYSIQQGVKLVHGKQARIVDTHSDMAKTAFVIDKRREELTTGSRFPDLIYQNIINRFCGETGVALAVFLFRSIQFFSGETFALGRVEVHEHVADGSLHVTVPESA